MSRRLTLPPHALPIGAFALVAVGLLGAAPLLARSLRAEARTRAAAELGAVAELKAREVVQWRADQLRVARFAASYPSVRRAAEALSSSGTLDPALAAHVTEVLGQLANLQSWAEIALLSRDSARVAGWARPGASLLPRSPTLVEAALASPEAAASDLGLDPADHPYLDVAVAVPGSGGRYALLARADAGPLVSELLERWPVPSRTAAASLAIRAGDHIRLFVSDSTVERYPRVESIPLGDRRRPVALAFDGATGLIEGLDFHGTPIFVESRVVPGTAWRVQTKLAVEEIEASLRRPLGIIYLLGGALLAAAAFLLALSWRQQVARARLDARLRDAQERLALAVTGTHSVWDWDLAGGALHLEPPSPLGEGEPVAALAGRMDEILARIAHPDDAPALRARLEAHLRGETALLESEHRLPSGGAGPIWIRVRGRVIRRDAARSPLRFAAVVSDVTERRRMQAQLELSQRMAGLGTLAAGVAHEINNPLASVSANLEFLSGEVEGSPLAEVVSEARDGAERVRDVVRGLRAFSSPEVAGRAPVDVRSELEAAVRLCRNEIRHRARLEVRLGDDLPLVEAGAHELGQVFLNLLLNAAQAIPEGHAAENVIEVVAGRSSEGAASVRIRDTGVGIPPHVLDRIFEPFFTTKAHGVGTGLGLAIAHRIVADAGGRIEVETQVGDGTAFHVLLPAARVAPVAEPPSAAEERPSGAAPRRVLVVDDDALVARAVVRTLEGRFQVVSVSSAPEALARIDAGERFDAVLCDLMMPQMTGMELHARLSARDPALARRMLFMTGGAFSEAAARFVAESPARCVEKPFEPARLRDAVERLALP